jgi:hypothetical protein
VLCVNCFVLALNACLLWVCVFCGTDSLRERERGRQRQVQSRIRRCTKHSPHHQRKRAPHKANFLRGVSVCSVRKCMPNCFFSCSCSSLSLLLFWLFGSSSSQPTSLLSNQKPVSHQQKNKKKINRLTSLSPPPLIIGILCLSKKIGVVFSPPLLSTLSPTHSYFPRFFSFCAACVLNPSPGFDAALSLQKEKMKSDS